MSVAIHQIWPPRAAGPLDAAAIEQLYTYPDGDWLAVNLVGSADGAVELHGTAAELSNPADQYVLRLGSDLADVLLVGATTAMVEAFRGQHPDDQAVRRRRRHNLSSVAPTVVVTTGVSLPANAPVITDALVPTIVVTPTSTPPALRSAWADAGATVLVCGDHTVDLRQARVLLADRGLRRIDCEGGPHLVGALLAAGLVDELRLTISPTLVVGTAGRITSGPLIPPAALTLHSVVAAQDTLMLRYLTATPPITAGG
jgi:riboflavin biosynthesis pyrimidine reductase